MYLSDNNGRYMAPLTASAYGTHCQWPVFIEKYVRSPKVFECPANSTGLYRSGCPAPEPLDDEGHMQEWTGGYRMADCADLADSYISLDWGRENPQPSGIALIVDAGHESTGSTIGFCRSEGCLSEPPVEESFARSGLATKPVHGDRKNVLFADGHVKALTQQQLFQPSMWAF
jgi:prepilin-type processing-associated H-X9-DG protein